MCSKIVRMDVHDNENWRGSQRSLNRSQPILRGEEYDSLAFSRFFEALEYCKYVDYCVSRSIEHL